VMSLTALVGLVTITFSSYMIRFNRPLFRWALRWNLLRPFVPKALLAGGDAPEAKDHGGQMMEGHIIVVGMNSLGRRIAQLLTETGYEVVAVDTDPKKLAGLPCRTELGNVSYRAVLDHLCLRRARLLVSALKIDSINDTLAYRAREAGVPCAVHVHDIREMDNLVDLGTDYLMISKVDGLKRLNTKLKELGSLPAGKE